jgi:hypothetical protein
MVAQNSGYKDATVARNTFTRIKRKNQERGKNNSPNVTPKSPKGSAAAKETLKPLPKSRLLGARTPTHRHQLTTIRMAQAGRESKSRQASNANGTLLIQSLVRLFTKTLKSRIKNTVGIEFCSSHKLGW